MTLQRLVALVLSVPLLDGGLDSAARQGTNDPTAVAPTSTRGSIAPSSDQELGDLRAVQAEALTMARVLAGFADEIEADIERDEIYRGVLAYDPEDKDARKALGYTKKKDEWVFKKYTEPKNRATPEQLAELQRRRTEAVDALEPKIDDCFPTDEPSVRHKYELRLELEKLVLLDGDNEYLRERVGHAWDEQRSVWRRAEVVAAKLDRAERSGLLEELATNVPVARTTEVDAGGKATNLAWATSVQIPRAHVMSMGSAKDAQTIASILHRAPDFLTGAFGLPDPAHGSQWRIYDMNRLDARVQFFDGYPGLTGDLEDFLLVSSSWLTECSFTIAGESPAERFDTAANQRVAHYLRRTFGTDTEDGWAFAGLCLYLSYQLCGTRLTIWMVRDEYGESDGPKLGERLRDPSVDWLEEARILLRGTNKPFDLASVLGKGCEQLTAEDLLSSYAVSAYLFEGRRRDLIQILQRIGKGETPVVVFESQLEMPIDALRARVVEWLSEMRAG